MMKIMNDNKPLPSEPCGVLIVDKPCGMTSHDVVNKLRKLYNTKQVGHTGTLDPMASGLMAVLVGRAVKASEYVTEHDKSYIAGLKLGITTDTEDISGCVLSSSDTLPAEKQVYEALSRFRGDIMQIPPMYSALKRGGEKLCDLARKGITVEREARPVKIFSLEAETVSQENGDYTLRVSCSRGTYIRTLCADIGKTLGGGGVMSSLRRVNVGDFDIAQAHTIDEISGMTDTERYSLLIDTEMLFSELPIVKLPEFFANLALSGNEIYLRKIGIDMPVGALVRMYDKAFFSLGQVREFPDGNAIKPVKKFRI